MPMAVVVCLMRGAFPQKTTAERPRAGQMGRPESLRIAGGVALVVLFVGTALHREIFVGIAEKITVVVLFAVAGYKHAHVVDLLVGGRVQRQAPRPAALFVRLLLLHGLDRASTSQETEKASNASKRGSRRMSVCRDTSRSTSLSDRVL